MIYFLKNGKILTEDDMGQRYELEKSKNKTISAFELWEKSFLDDNLYMSSPLNEVDLSKIFHQYGEIAAVKIYREQNNCNIAKARSYINRKFA